MPRYVNEQKGSKVPIPSLTEFQNGSVNPFYFSPQFAHKDQYDWLAVLLFKAVWKSATTMCGEQYVMIALEQLMLK